MMSQTISLRGRNALSPFRYDKLMRSLAASAPAVTHVYAEYWHFVATERALDASEHERLVQILSYGPAAKEEQPEGELLLVTPRFGTISP
ncbi:MAG: hypothetical protein Q7U24_08865, partial [Sulfurimicrobium sp.]|nr:hypothetical protein [Sulfurimicrobium sp.]